MNRLAITGGILLAGIFAVTPAWTAEWKDLVNDCGSVKDKFGFASLKTCTVDLFTAHPFHLGVESIVPGGGTGIGGVYTHRFDRGKWQRDLTLTAASSFRKFWIANAQLTALHPKLGGEWNTARDSLKLEFYTRARGLPRMTYYGIGPDVPQANLTNFRERDLTVGGSVFNPITKWLAAGGAFESLWPDVSGVSDAGERSIETVFNESSAPGLTRQPNLLHYEVFANPRYKAAAFEASYRIGYNFYQDHNTGHYSFRRFRADLQHTIYVERTHGHPRPDSMLLIHGLYSAANTSAGNAVPFYLQETLGGSDINGDPTLRGFRDYRFRGPNVLLLQGEADRRIWKFIGLMAFYDTGKVAARTGQLNFGNLRHSYGFGTTFWAGGKVVFRAYVGFGSGEGYHPFFGVANLL